MTHLRFTPLKRSEINKQRANNIRKNTVICDYSSIFKQGDLYYVDIDGKAYGPFQTIVEAELVINEISAK